MFKAFYGMEFNPFDKNLDTKYCYKSEDFKQASSRLEYLKEIKGFGLFTGNSGTGKSFTLRHFSESLNPNLFKSIYIPVSTLTVMDFYRALSYELGLAPAFKKIDMFKQIQESMGSYYPAKNITPVIILDEAQYLKNAILDDLKILFNFNMDSKNCAVLILSGQPILNSILQRQNHEALRQRIVMNYTFRGLSRTETEEYILSRFSVCGVKTTIFTADAVELIASLSGGYARKINLLIEKALIIGFQKKTFSLDSQVVYDAQGEIDLTI
jgi:type II secretory pathway predicted ATPase ExeA